MLGAGTITFSTKMSATVILDSFLFQFQAVIEQRTLPWTAVTVEL